MGVMDKFKTMLGMSDDEFDDDEFMEDETDDVDEYEDFNKGKKGKIVKIHTTAQLNVVVMQIETFDEAREIADHIKTKRPVVINLEKLDGNVARRVVDFLSGATYALDGNIQKISSGIFLVTPYNVGIMGDFKDELRSKSLFGGM